ncbi:MAG: hypothetical protein H7A21_16965 [Spirochaetales bacterium]|nr:hypothetical protein [Leptospiraceae bacterium]MCP5483131.1 hypothetical protein [Spirochaetales bacterium]MCP5484571.1 hypothetical protein [Spirochaetales bacterium]
MSASTQATADSFRARIQKLSERARSHPYFTASLIFVLLLWAALGAYWLWGRDFLFDSEVQELTQLIPEEATFAMEIRDPAGFLTLAQELEPGPDAIRAWSQLANSPAFGEVQTIAYLLELKTGDLFPDLTALQDRPVAFAMFPDGSSLGLIQTSPASRLGAALAAAFAEQTIHMPGEESYDSRAEPTQNDSSPEEYVVRPEDSLPALIEEREALRNLEISHFRMGQHDLYMVFFGDVLFLADELETLVSSLRLAGSSTTYSLANQTGMPAARERLKSGGAALVYLRPTASFPGAFVPLAGGDEGLAIVLRAEVGGQKELLLEGSLHAIGTPTRYPATTGSVDWPARLPANEALTAAIFSPTVSGNQLPDLFAHAGDSLEDSAESIEELLELANLNQNVLGREPGFALVLHGFAPEGLYPRMTYAANGTDANAPWQLTAALFGNGEARVASLHGIDYRSLARAGEHHYVPACAAIGSGAFAGLYLISSGEDALRPTIAGLTGRAPVLADMSDQIRSDAPLQIILNVSEVRRNLRRVLEMTGQESGRFTVTTVDRDLMPLFDLMKHYRLIHITAGIASPEASGRIDFLR